MGLAQNILLAANRARMSPFRRRTKQSGVVSLAVVLLVAACARGVRTHHYALNSVGFSPLRCDTLARFISVSPDSAERASRVLKSLTLQLEPKYKRGCLRIRRFGRVNALARRGALGPNPAVQRQNDRQQQIAGVVQQVPPIGPSRCRWQDIPCLARRMSTAAQY